MVKELWKEFLRTLTTVYTTTQAYFTSGKSKLYIVGKDKYITKPKKFVLEFEVHNNLIKLSYRNIHAPYVGALLFYNNRVVVHLIPQFYSEKNYKSKMLSLFLNFLKSKNFKVVEKTIPNTNSFSTQWYTTYYNLINSVNSLSLFSLIIKAFEEEISQQSENANSEIITTILYDNLTITIKQNKKKNSVSDNTAYITTPQNTTFEIFKNILSETYSVYFEGVFIGYIKIDRNKKELYMSQDVYRKLRSKCGSFITDFAKRLQNKLSWIVHNSLDLCDPLNTRNKIFVDTNNNYDNNIRIIDFVPEKNTIADFSQVISGFLN